MAYEIPRLDYPQDDESSGEGFRTPEEQAFVEALYDVQAALASGDVEEAQKLSYIIEEFAPDTEETEIDG
jgi:hypothetical protein